MKKLSLLFILNLIVITAFSEPIRVACVGNSITYGATIVNREKNSYPAQLQSMLGAGYQVMNFGVSGTTLLKNGNSPYRNTKEYANALAFHPDIVFIKLGTNDSKAVNRPFLDEFENNYTELIGTFRNLPSKPRVILLLPLPSFLDDSLRIYDPVIKNRIIPMIQSVAYQTGCEVIDLYQLFIDKPQLVPDKIHPSALGATVIARRLYEVIKLNEDKNFDIFSKMKEEKKLSSYYGFECATFTFNNRECKIVKPRKPAAGRPWIWRARFWGHEPQTEIALLERGFHLVYCDVAELYGNQEAVKTWNLFYDYMQQLGLARKVALEGFSRGGVYIYNWALANPRKVDCIYADAPVLDFKSWPGGKGKSKGNPRDWEIFRKDYNLTEEQALAYDKNPLDRAAKIARLGIPMLHVVGDADDVVPFDENTGPFEIKVKKAGGDITVIHKPGINHHPHSLPNPTPIVDFILRYTGYKTNFAVIPAPASEYRSAAGWKEGREWWAQRHDIDSLLAAQKGLDIIYLGNSITQAIGGHRPNVTGRSGFAAFDSLFHGYTWESAGISGDRTQHLLWRLENGTYKEAQPKVIVVTIGVNNFPDDSPEEVAAGIKEIVKWIGTNLPQTKIILCGPLPAGTKQDNMLRVKYEKVHEIICKYRGKNLYYLNLSHIFIKPDGDLNPDLCAADGIHLVRNGYKAWAAELRKEMDKILIEPRVFLNVIE